MKKLPILLAVLILAVSVVGVFAACQPAEAQAHSFVAIDINPSIELTLDKNNRVVSVRAMNEDAQVLLFEATGIEGKSVDKAVEKIAELATEYGYVTEENGVISVTVSSDDAATEQELFDKIKKPFEDHFTKEGIQAQLTNAAGAFQQYKLDQLKAQYPNNADIQALTPGKYRLVRSAMAVDKDLTVEQAAAMSCEQLSAVVKTAHEYYKDKINDAYEAVYEEAKIAYETAKSLLLDGMYATVDLTDIELCLNGTKYLALRTAYFALLKIEEVDLAAQEFLTQAQVEEACAQLQLSAEETAAIVKSAVNEQGKATEESIEYAIERMLANMPQEDAKALEEKFDEVEDYLEDVMEQIAASSQQLLSQVESQIAALKTVITLPEMEDLEDLEDVIEAIEAEIEKLQKWFDENMTDAQKQTLKDRQDKVNSELKALEDQFKQAVATARDEAHRHMEQRRQERKQQMGGHGGQQGGHGGHGAH